MSLLNSIGSSLVGYLSLGDIGSMPTQNYLNIMQQYAAPMQQQYVPCKHPDCQICAEDAKRWSDLIKKEKEISAQKEEDYKQRCKDYIVKFRSQPSA